MHHSEKAPAMGTPVEMGVAKAAGHHTPVSGLPRDFQWPMRKAAGHQAPVPELAALQPAAAEEVVATAQVALASNPKVGGE